MAYFFLHSIRKKSREITSRGKRYLFLSPLQIELEGNMGNSKMGISRYFGNSEMKT